MSCVQYVTETKVYSSNAQTDSNCNSIIFINTGQSNVNVDNLVLTPGQQLAIAGNFNEINVKIYQITFLGTTAPALTVIYKRYI